MLQSQVITRAICVISTTLIAGFWVVLSAQDIHFSQFFNNPLLLNPGNTGVFEGDQRLRAGYRNQWSNVVPWETFSASYDRKFKSRYCADTSSFFAAGLLFNYDRSSEISDLKLSNLNLTGSYTLRIDSTNSFTFGGLVGIATRRFDSNSLTWDRQWDESTFQFNRSFISGEEFSSERVSYFETGLGINYRWLKSERTRLDIGFGLFHFIQPRVGFYDDDDIKLCRRYTFTAIGDFETSNRFNLMPFGMLQFQGPYTEGVLGGLGKFYVKQKPGKHVEVHVGIGHRWGVAWFPMIAVQYNNFYGSISYDIDASNINEVKGVRPNTIEMHFGYIIAQPKWEKICPVY